MPKRKSENREVRLSPAEREAVEKFAPPLQKLLSRVSRDAEQVQELLGRWEQFSEGAPGLLGGSLLAVVAEAVLVEQMERLSERLSEIRRPPSELADHADFFAGLVTEFAALVKVLAQVELDPGNRLADDWDKLAEGLLEKAAEVERIAEEMEGEAEQAGESAEEEPEEQFPTVSPLLVREIWRKTLAGEELEGEQARLAGIMQQHPEYRAAWESGAPAGAAVGTIEGVNPFVHVTMHVAVERQLADEDPPETGAALERLTAGGIPRHDALHRIGNVMMEHLYRMRREKRDFDRQAYLHALTELKP